MKRQWSKDKNEIIEELKALDENEIPLLLARPGEVSTTITVRHILGDAHSVLVEIGKPADLVLDEAEPYYVFYQREKQALMRGFSLRFVLQSERYVRANLPTEIFEIQRRKYPRVFTPQQSTLTCIPQNSRRLFAAQVLDVSLEGAKIFGDLEGLGKGSVLSPLTLTLFLESIAAHLWLLMSPRLLWCARFVPKKRSRSPSILTGRMLITSCWWNI